MQLNKASKKTSKVAEKAAASASEKVASAETVTKPRAVRSSKTKKSEGIDMTSGKNLHKPAKNTVVESTPRVEVKPASESPKEVIGREEIAKLAYFYWVERGCAHGAAEEDWLRAERELTAS
jgi:hypothetical protein